MLQCVLQCDAVCCSVASMRVYTLRLQFDFRTPSNGDMRVYLYMKMCTYMYGYLYIYSNSCIYELVVYIRVGFICEYTSWFYVGVGANWCIHMYDINSYIHIYHIYTRTYVYESWDQYEWASKLHPHVKRQLEHSKETSKIQNRPPKESHFLGNGK